MSNYSEEKEAWCNVNRNWQYLDPKRERKEVEAERRKLRLVQVREESKKLAKKIRTNVAAEKERQLRNLEERKSKELDCWRQNSLNQKYNDYRSSIFQVGAAHRAAAAEKVLKREAANKRDTSTDGCYDLKLPKTSQNMPPINKETKGSKKKFAFSNAKEPTAAAAGGSKITKAIDGNKHVGFCSINASIKMDSCEFDKEEVEACGENKTDTKSKSSPVKIERKAQLTEERKEILQKTPVVVDIDVENCANVTISDFDVDDTHIQNNRKFTRIVRLTPKKNVSTKITVEPAEISPDHKNSLSKATVADNRTKDPKSCSPKETGRRRKRISVISDYLKKSQEVTTLPIKCLHECQKSSKYFNDKPSSEPYDSENRGSSLEVNNFKSSNSNADKNRQGPLGSYNQNFKKLSDDKQPSLRSNNEKPLEIQDLQPIESMARSVQKSSQKQLLGNIAKKVCTTKESIKLGKANEEKLSKKSEARHCPRQIVENWDKVINEIPEALGSLKEVHTETNLKSRKDTDKLNISSEETPNKNVVEYYDYINRFGKSYIQPTNIIHAETQNQHGINAIELAKLEKKNKVKNLCASHKLRKSTDIRGKKALEREQLKRDCDDFTEKLDGLMKQYPQLLSKDDELNKPTETAPKELQNESIMNTMVEDILLRPAIITCPYIGGSYITSTRLTDLNLAEMRDRRSHSVLNTSSCYDFLGKVTDHTRDLEKFLKTNKNDTEKIEQLKMLMCRVEQLRLALIEELKKERSFQQKILSKSKISSGMQSESKKDIKMTDKKTHLSEELETIKSVNSDVELSRNKHPQSNHRDEKCKLPVEIIIQVQGEDMIDIKQQPTKSDIPVMLKTKVEKSKFHQTIISSDSNSTSYKSLPSVFKGKTGTLEVENCENYEDPFKKGSYNVHPLIEHYVQRLLGMNRKSVKSLCVSSSDIETPNSSIVNTKNNRLEQELMSEDKLKRVEKFISDNRCFINQLECSLASQNYANPEKNMKLFDEIWKSQLEKPSKKMRNKKPEMFFKTPTNQANNKQSTKNAKSGDPHAVDSTKRIKPHLKSSKDKPINGFEESSSTFSKSDNEKRATFSKAEEERKSSPETQIERYAELTENCTQRIKELTDLITLVREEKKKLLEVTLSSVSETGRNSTEYYELPVDQRGNPNSKSLNSSSRQSNSSELNMHEKVFNIYKNNELVSLESVENLSLPTLKTSLAEGKPISTSLDSGISCSRPVTVLEQQTDTDTQIGLANTDNPSNICQKKSKPPATMKRFSPRMVDGEHIHELSTITEVETPVTSRINTSATFNHTQKGRTLCDKKSPILSGELPSGVFPTFEQYLKDLKLDRSSLGEEESMRLQLEFKQYISSIRDAKEKGFNIEYFPDFSSYIECNCTPGLQNSSVEENIKEVISRMRLEDVLINSFPNKDDYMNNYCKSPSQNTDILDSESLENISENIVSHPILSDSCSESLDIENELRKRNLLKSSFRRSHFNNVNNNFAESTRNDEINLKKLHRNSLASECDKSSTSTSLPSSLEHHKKALGLFKNKRCESGTTSTTTTTIPTPGKSCAIKSNKKGEINGQDLGKPLNLRDFLSKELEKHKNTSISTTTCSDDSIRNLFLQSILENLSPSGNLESNRGTAITIDRQKTSTPVGSANTSTRSQSARTSSNFFSGASQISSVHYQENATKSTCKKCSMKICCNCK